MSRFTHEPSPRSRISEEAAGWLIECRAGHLGPNERARFDAWLRASPEHVRAYLELLPAWEAGAGLSSWKNVDERTLLEWASATPSNVVSVAFFRRDSRQGEPAGAHTGDDTFHRQRISWRKLGALAVALTLLIAFSATWLYTQKNAYSTEIGEQRTLVLSDGSVVELNARSRLKVRFTAGTRDIDLIEGQALFRVAHDPSRPFTVRSGDTHVRAVGTQFDVYRKHTGTVVTVIEGRVSVSHEGEPGEHSTPVEAHLDESAHAAVSRELTSETFPDGAMLVKAGEQLTLSAGEPIHPVAANTEVATAWTQRRLVFSATPLDEVAREFNRYNIKPLVLDSPALAALRINGVFSSTDPATLLAFLREEPGIVIIESEKEIRVTRNSAATSR